MTPSYGDMYSISPSFTSPHFGGLLALPDTVQLEEAFRQRLPGALNFRNACAEPFVDRNMACPDKLQLPFQILKIWWYKNDEFY